MPSVNRILNTPTGRQQIRRLFGRSGYFPVTRGHMRKFGLRATNSISDGLPDWPGRSESGMTLAEWRINWAHLTLGLKTPDDFIPQYDIFGDGTVRVDYYEVPIDTVIEIQGFYAHYVGYDAFQVERDARRRSLILSTGKIVIFIDAQDAELDPVYYLEQALKGMDLSRFTRGIA